jgi:hypothetical protein
MSEFALATRRSRFAINDAKPVGGNREQDLRASSGDPFVRRGDLA